MKKWKKIDKDFLEVSGSKEQYYKDMIEYCERLKKSVLEARKTAYGRKKLKRAGLS